jgi:ABC-type phosphate/phosphonate transport system substrate-binding protein
MGLKRRLTTLLLLSLATAMTASSFAVAGDSEAMNTPPMRAIANALLKKVSFTPATPAKNNLQESIAEDQEALIFSAPPRETPEAGIEMYKPVAEYLSKAIGKKVVYKHPGTWGVYRTEMLKGNYDIVFDGPHFNSYRVEKLNHNVLVKIPEHYEFAVIVRKDRDITNLQQMAGRTFCAHAPPNLGTLVLLSQFDNPSRQPAILNTNGWDTIYENVVNGKCVGGVLPVLNLKALDRTGATKVVFKTQAIPNQAFSAGPRVSTEDQTRIAQALVSPAAAIATAKLRAAYKVGNSFAPANNQEYKGLASYLKNDWGYY